MLEIFEYLRIIFCKVTVPLIALTNIIFTFGQKQFQIKSNFLVFKLFFRLGIFRIPTLDGTTTLRK